MQLTDKFSPNFSLKELLVTNHKEFINIQLEECQQYLDNAYRLVYTVLQPIRIFYKKPIIILSGFRGKSLNDKIKGVQTSDHCKFLAADFYVEGIEKSIVMKDIINNKLPITCRQLIYEKPNQDKSGWIHCAVIRTPFDINDKYMDYLYYDGKKYEPYKV